MLAQPSRRLWFPVVAYMGFIFVLSSVSKTPPIAGHTDKWLHGLLYAGLSVLIVRAVTNGWREPLRPGLALAAAALATAYGIGDEIHQHFVPPRQADVLDVAADAAGATLAAFVLYGWDIIRERHAL